MTRPLTEDIALDAINDYIDGAGEIPDADVLITALPKAELLGDSLALNTIRECWDYHVRVKG